jgi:site-specific DNA recombinase
VEELLSKLRNIINKEHVTFKYKRYVILSLVDEVKVITLEDDLKHKYAKIDISYKFNIKRENVNTIDHTDVRDDNTLDKLLIKKQLNYKNNSILYVETHSPAYRIKKSRIDKNLSLKELSSLSNISYNYLTALESGRYKLNFRVLNKLSQVLDKPIWYLGCFEDMSEDNFIDKFKKARHYYGDSKKKLANKIEANECTIRDWEKGLRFPSDKYIKFIEEYMTILDNQD